MRAVVVGSSTGGPEALSRVFSALSTPLPVPVLVVQHRSKDAAGLLACVQIAAIELHGWGATEADPAHPKWLLTEAGVGYRLREVTA